MKYRSITMEIKDTTCCGLKEFNGLQSFYSLKQKIEAVVEYIRFEDFKFIFFTENDDNYFRHGNELIKYIKDNKLGSTSVSRKAINPNSEKRIRVIVWCIDADKLKKHYDNLK